MPISTTAHAARTRVWTTTLFVVAVATGLTALTRGLNATATATPTPFPSDHLTDQDLSVMHAPTVVVPQTLLKRVIQPGEEVIGVTAGGIHRAYSVRAFATLGQHVVNDLLVDIPVTVAHCPRTGCTRVFTGPAGQRLRLALGGWSGRDGAAGMLLRVDGERDDRRYLQNTGRSLGGESVPYPSLEFELTTWEEWRRSHPNSDVFTGGAVTSH